MDRQVVEVSSLSLSLSVSFSDYLPAYPPIHLMHPSISLSLSVCLPIYLQACKRSYSARLPQFLKLDDIKNAASQRDSSIFALDNIKNEAILRDPLFFKVGNIKNKAILRDVLQKWKVECFADGLVPMRFAIFSVHLSKLLRQVMPGHTKCCTCHAKSSQQTWKSEAPKCNPSQEISARASQQLWWTSLALRLPRKVHLCRSSSNVPRLRSFVEMLQNPHWQGPQSLAPATRNDIWTSKSASSMWCF